MREENVEQTNTMNLLRGLIGKWHGEGTGEFPTISSFPYREELEFTTNDVQPHLHYEQRTWKKLPNGDYSPSHWESGFWHILSARDIELVCAQRSGRVEVLHGTLELLDTGFRVYFQSDLVANGTRVEKTAREFILKGGTLQYAMQMSTAAVPSLTLHTHAELHHIAQKHTSDIAM